MAKEKNKKEDAPDEERSPEDLIREPFPGDQDKVIEPNWKPAIYLVPPLLVGGVSWLAGIHELFHWLMLTLIGSAALTGILYYLFFAESDYISGFFQNFRKR